MLRTAHVTVFRTARNRLANSLLLSLSFFTHYRLCNFTVGTLVEPICFSDQLIIAERAWDDISTCIVLMFSRQKDLTLGNSSNITNDKENNTTNITRDILVQIVSIASYKSYRRPTK